MHEVRVDPEKNRLYLTFEKLDGPEEITEVGDEIREACQSLTEGFTCLTDMRNYELLDRELEVFIRGVQEFLVEAGMSKVVRVVRRFDRWGHLQFDRSSMGIGYHAENVNTIEEALAILDGENGE
ncbi:MAG: hypothetical protein ACLFPD_05675 [Desulfosudaceae bacterium]